MASQNARLLAPSASGADSRIFPRQKPEKSAEFARLEKSAARVGLSDSIKAVGSVCAAGRTSPMHMKAVWLGRERGREKGKILQGREKQRPGREEVREWMDSRGKRDGL